jgi:hypothetical protein
MGEVGMELTRHFFRRFFDNDTVRPEGDTLTTVVRALAAVSVPGMMAAFWLQNQYPGRSTWGSISDQYFFVVYSFVAMGGVAIFEWEMLFPDRMDFLILSPLPLGRLRMLGTKAAALVGFLLLFLVSCNLFCGFGLPLVSKGEVGRQLVAHWVAVLLAGGFAALLVLALGGVLLCVLGGRWFRVISPAMQLVSVAVLALLMVHYVRYGGSLEQILAEPLGWGRWMPPFWFLGVYECLLHGDAAPGFARELAGYGVHATEIVAAVVLVTYPLAWARMRRLAIEGTSLRRGSGVIQRSVGWCIRFIRTGKSKGKIQGSHAALRMTKIFAVVRFLKAPAERAAFGFVGRTIARENRYQAYLAIYGGVGLALAMACAVGIGPGGLVLNDEGLHAVMPLVLFWGIAGLRTAFGLPLNLTAGWIFRVTGVDLNACAAGTRRWVLTTAMGCGCGVLALLALAGWDWRRMLVQAVVGASLCVLLTDGFHSSDKRVPFNRPRLPGRTNLPMMLTLYVGVLPVGIYGAIAVEAQLEQHLWRLATIALGTALIHAGVKQLRSGPAEVEEEMEGYEDEFQILGLS